MDIEGKAIKWLISSGIMTRTSYRRGWVHNPDILTTDGQGFEIKTCYGAKFFWHSRQAPGEIIFSSMKQWIELAQHPEYKILVFGEGSKPLAIIPMSELPLGTLKWNDLTIKVMKDKIVERAVKRDLAMHQAEVMHIRHPKIVERAVKRSLVSKE